ncbi:MAG: aspartate 1-decarboxylase [Nitrososphaeraceae archaeon]
MLLTKLKSKLHRVSATDSFLQYEGSCRIDRNLMEAANIEEYEQIHIYNTNNGERFLTYAIPGSDNEIAVMGAAARKVAVGDVLIICTYCQCSPASDLSPITVYVDSENQII